jgi:hypothetical protein
MNESDRAASFPRPRGCSERGNDELPERPEAWQIRARHAAALRIYGRRNVLESRTQNPAKRRFEVQRTLGCGDLWITEYVIFYDGRPVPTVSIMKFRDGKVAHEIQYFADRLDAPAWRAKWETKPH